MVCPGAQQLALLQTLDSEMVSGWNYGDASTDLPRTIPGEVGTQLIGSSAYGQLSAAVVPKSKPFTHGESTWVSRCSGTKL